MVVIFVMLLNSDVVVLRILMVVILLFLVIVWEYDVIMLLKNFFIELILIWVGFVGGIIWGIKLFWKWSIWVEFVLNNFIFYFVYLILKNLFNGFIYLCCSFEKRKIFLFVNDFD